MPRVRKWTDCSGSKVPKTLMAVVWTPTGQWSTAMGEADISSETPLSTAMQYRIGSQQSHSWQM
jgi:hypothetical protein